MKHTIVSGSAEKEFASSEEKMVIVLMSFGYYPVRIDAEGVICTYYFNYPDVIELANKVSCGDIDDLNIPLKDLWAAQNAWKMNISRARRANSES